MKKMISLLAACALCGSLLAALPVSAEETATRKTGDIDGDGYINTDDACCIMRYYAHSILNTESEFLEAYKTSGKAAIGCTLDFSLEIADINKDGVIDTDDAVLIQKFFAKNIIDLAPDTIEEMMAAYKK